MVYTLIVLSVIVVSAVLLCKQILFVSKFKKASTYTTGKITWTHSQNLFFKRPSVIYETPHGELTKKCPLLVGKKYQPSYPEVEGQLIGVHYVSNEPETFMLHGNLGLQQAMMAFYIIAIICGVGLLLA